MQTERAPVGRGEKGTQEKFCQYHKCAGHNTDECRALKGCIYQLIKEGSPRRPNEEARRDDKCREDRFKRRRPDQSPPRDQRRRRTPEERERQQRENKGQDDREATSRGNKERRTTSRNEGGRESQCSAVVKHGYINMISGGLGGGGETSNARKRHLRQCLAISGGESPKINERNRRRSP